jgi:transposase, IS30 family
VQSRGALRRDLAVYLHTGRAVRRPSRKVGQRKNRIPNMINISERPPEVEDRAVPYKPEQVRDALAAKIKTLPDSLRLSLTWDQGPEMRDWKHVSIDADIDIYFCDPHSPWHCGTNENTNGLLRQYFPTWACTAAKTWTGSPKSSMIDPSND